ncbi:Coenzyme F420-dependent N5 N10-methylene tetrahydromethanopterin reductase-like protein [Xylanimonas cellulosilytica DSM 15894]|uniref:Coenzyme F420-dependent N5 N10-methylene tetrahydromethanopterin reductase-like protein n=1 Tax=Xylanimonas cellulosilytica (strain DSM 15894 / JCM 12276 / CECT 5975 / KCTC 9989 / LMG 20990 / NBRC 107835 / XIL07) TaxID=446471 RepID=D1BZX0_XYLCX|nr:LLM class flavin-dependent oxidoreductase [Xylanimonas cellulosilytica]ACZ32098.1 Coenzyme F420-dependent N5 N10-methylene tetrahydromethanopterin reductase-like protein [Xylanimonas cellulosilytica DSM 15894]
MPRTTRQVILGVDLTTAGARALRTPGVPMARPFDGERFVRLVRIADHGLLDLVVLDEPFLLHPGRSRVSGRLDSAVAAARVAPLTEGIGLVAALDTMHLDPSAVAAAIASIDHASGGRSGWQVGCPAGVGAADERWPVQSAADARRVVRSWDVDGVAAAHEGDGRVRVDHDGIRFAVRRGTAARTPLPQGRPPVVMRVRGERCVAAAAAAADVVRIVAPDRDQASALRSAVHAAAVAAGRDPRELKYVAEAFVVLATDRESALTRRLMLEALEGPDVGGGALVVAGTPAELTQTVTDWVDADVVDGFLLRPAALDADLDAVVRGLVPALQSRGRFRAARTAGTLRESLGLPRPAPIEEGPTADVPTTADPTTADVPATAGLTAPGPAVTRNRPKAQRRPTKQPSTARRPAAEPVPVAAR